MKKWVKILLITLGSIIGLLVILVAVFFGVWNNEIRTIMSIDLVVEANDDNHSGPIYKMEVKGDYYFRDFLEQGGAESDDALIDHIVDGISKGVLPISISAPNIQANCSSFTGVTSDNHRLFGRNYDFSTTSGMLVFTESSKKEFGEYGSRHATFTSVDLQFLGIKDGRYLDGIMDKGLCLAATYAPLDGINDAGVSCGIYMSYQGPNETHGATSTNQQTDKPDLTSTTMLRMILDYADNVEEAVKIASSYDLHDSANTSFHYMVADASGKSAILEWVPVDGDSKNDTDGTKRELNVIYNDDDSHIGEEEGKNEFQYITNFLITPGYYMSDEEKAGYDRYLQIEKQINPDGNNTKGLMTKEEGLAILETVGRRKWDAAQGESDGNGITVWSALYDLTEKSGIWVSNEEFNNEEAIFNIKLDGKKFVFA